jgi:predicted metal-dependent phosphotriesterase family hydrolase
MSHDQPSREDHAQTVLDLVAPESIGLTLPHEHLFVDLRFLSASRRPEAAAGTDATGGLGNLYEINHDWFSLSWGIVDLAPAS